VKDRESNIETIINFRKVIDGSTLASPLCPSRTKQSKRRKCGCGIISHYGDRIFESNKLIEWYVKKQLKLWLKLLLSKFPKISNWNVEQLTGNFWTLTAEIKPGFLSAGSPPNCSGKRNSPSERNFHNICSCTIVSRRGNADNCMSAIFAETVTQGSHDGFYHPSDLMRTAAIDVYMPSSMTNSLVTSR